MSSQGKAERPTVKQQREARRAEKIEQFRRERERKRRNRRIAIAAAIVGGAALVALIVVAFVFAPRPASYQAGGDGAAVPGVETFTNTSAHVETPVQYPQSPPAGGEHSSTWLNCGVYGAAVPNENATHALEHGAVWVTYNADSVSTEDVAALRSVLPSTFAILSPYEGLDTPVAVSAWNAQLKLDSADTDKIAAFFEEYWQGDQAPEPGAPCTGGVDGPDRLS